MTERDGVAWVPPSSALMLVGFCGVIGMPRALLAVMVGIAHPIAPPTGLRAATAGLTFRPLYGASLIEQTGFPVSDLTLAVLVGFVGGSLAGPFVLRLLSRFT